MNVLSKFYFSILLLFFIVCLNKAEAQDWDLLWSYNIDEQLSAGQSGIETDGAYIYTNLTGSNSYAKYDLDGNWVETFSIPDSPEDVTDLAYDGQYFYCGNSYSSSSIYILDFSNQTIVGTIPALTYSAKHIAYDSEFDAFWYGNDASDIYLINRLGEIISTIDADILSIDQITGSAYDNYSEGGPYLWLHSSLYNECQSAIVQVNIATGSATGVWHDATIENGAGWSCGLFNSIEVAPGNFVIGGIVQGGNVTAFAYSIEQIGALPAVLTTPENNFFGADLLPLFQWQAVEDAISYQIQVSTQSNFASTEINESDITTLEYQTPENMELEELTQYFWRVRAKYSNDEYGLWSKKYNFITTGSLTQPVLIAPENNITGLSPNVQFTWTGSIAATNYILQVSNNIDFTDLVLNETELTNTQFSATGLEQNAQYWWRVNMYNATDTSVWSEEWTFSTGQFFQIGNGTTYNPQFVYPAPYGNMNAGARQQYLIRAEEIIASGGGAGYLTSLSFNVAILYSGAGLQDYEIKMINTDVLELDYSMIFENLESVYYNELYTPIFGWNSHTFSNPFFWDGISNVLIDVCFNNLTSRTYNEAVYWSQYPFQASRSFFANFNSEVCSSNSWYSVSMSRPNMLFSFEQVGILPPALEIPLNNTICISTTPLFDWSDVEDAVSYTLQISTTQDFQSIFFEQTEITESELQLSEANILNEISQYYWRVNASNDEDISMWSLTRGFITEGDLNTPLLVSPQMSGYELAIFQKFIWEPVFAASDYHLQIATDENFENIIYEINTEETEYLVTDLPKNSNIFWRVNAQNECSVSSYSVSNFTTNNDNIAYGYSGMWQNMGPVIFSLNNPEDMLNINPQSSQMKNNAGTWGNGIWYGIDWANRLITIDTETGDTTLINQFPISAISLAYDVQTDVMYGLDYENLYTIDVLTGETNLVGSLNSDFNFNNLAASIDGELYSICSYDDNLYKIDKFTAKPTIIGPTGLNTNFYESSEIEFDNNNNICYWSSYGRLLTVDITTGAATLVSEFPNMAEITCLAIPYIPACLSFPQLNYPENKAVCIDLLPEFDWSDVEGANNYAIQIANDFEFLDIVFEEDEITNTEFTLPQENSLDNQSLYYWRVMAFGNDSCNSYWSSRYYFVTEGNLTQAILLSPVNNETNCYTSLNFIWEKNPGVLTYNIQLSTDSEFDSLVIDESNLEDNYYFVSNLSVNTQYWWRVQMISPCSESQWSDDFTFTTGVFVTIGTGDSYTFEWDFPAPYGNAADGAKHQILILADELYDAGALGVPISSLALDVAQLFSGATLSDFTIKIKHTTDANLEELWDLDEWTTVYGPVDYTPSLGWNTHTFDNDFIWNGVSNVLIDICFNNPAWNSSRNEGIYYHETAFNATRWSSESANPMFCENPNYPTLSNLRPNMIFGLDFSGVVPPQLELPATNTLCNSTTPLFDWNDVYFANYYNLQVSTSSDFSEIVFEGLEIQISEYQLSELNELNDNTLYYWRVNASDGSNVSNWSRVSNFVTDGQLPQPILVFPSNEFNAFLPNGTLVWNDFDAAEDYSVQVAADANFVNILLNENEIISSSLEAYNLEPNTQYWWRVKMSSPCSESQWSEIWTFKTANIAQIGDGTAFNEMWEYPAPYGNMSPGAKHQILIRAEELIDAGIAPGDLNSLAFNVAQLNSGAVLSNFTISIKSTIENEIGDQWDMENWNLVFGPVDYIPTLGWNNHQFENPFAWDGVSNVLIDVCFNNDIKDQSTNESVYYSTTEFLSVRYFSGYENVCTEPYYVNPSFIRPNIMFASPSVSEIEAPTLIAPINNAIDISTTPVFEWNTTTGALNYTLQVSTSEDFSTVLLEQTGLIAPNYTIQESEMLNDLTAYFWRVKAINNEILSDWSETWSFTTELETFSQEIPLNSGWNIISSYIEPENDTIINIFENIATDVKIVKNGAGQMYDPAFNINTIGNWNFADGYLVNMLNDNELTITGTKLLPETTPINLNNGWNLSAYFRDNDMSPATALASITSSLVLAKDNAGGIFSPVYGINTIGDMHPGQGYYFYMDAAAELTYPANSAQKAVAGNNITPLAKSLVPSMSNTGKNSTLIISIESNDGNEIGIYNMNDELIGAGAIYNGVAAITIWGDDDITSGVDGAKDNEYLNIKIYNTNDNTSKEISLSQIKEITSDTEQSELYYKTNAIYVAKASAHNESGFAMSIKNIPNPVENDVVFEFGLTQEANAEIQIYTSTGELVASIANDNYSAGIHRINFDASNLANGMYNIVLSSGERRVTSFMIVNK